MSEEQQNNNEELDLKSIEIRSEEVQEILGYIPHWIIRWGISIFLGVIFVILAGSWFFKYPDVISSTIVVTTTNPPASLVAHTAGKIQHLFITDNQEVKKDDYLVIIENSVDHTHLKELKRRLDSNKKLFTQFKSRNFIDFNPDYSMGELHSHYAAFLKNYSDYRFFIELGYHRKKIAAHMEQIEKYREQYESNQRQINILKDELVLSEQKHERAQSLFRDGIISLNDFESAKGAFLQKKYSFEGAKSSLTNSRIQITQLEQTILELELKQKEQTTQLQSLLKQSYENLMAQISIWEQRYVLKAPMDGVVSFTSFWSVNQNVKAGDRVVTVLPQENSKIIGKVVLPVQGAGKVEVGQKVNVKFADYPFMDYGMVRGIVKSKSLISADSHYHLEVHFPFGLRTNYKKELDFHQEMQGIADIITEDVRMLERIFKPIKSMLERQIDD